jgi:hypothetical protein
VQRKGALPGKISARCIPKRLFAGHFGCMARISCQSQPVFGCMARESCRELAIFPSEAAFGMHGAQNLPRTAARERIAREYCHCQSGQECIRAQSCRRRTLGGRTAREYCHYQSPENAFRAYPAIAGRLGMHSVDILPSADIRECAVSAYLHCQSPGHAALSTRGSGHSAFSGLNCWERFRVCAVSVGNHELASRSAKLCRIMC